jgi:N-acetyl-gamma-glutamyl-phosphate reductase
LESSAAPATPVSNCCALLAQHPEVQVVAITSRGDAGTAVAKHVPEFARAVDLKFEDPATANLKSL